LWIIEYSMILTSIFLDFEMAKQIELRIYQGMDDEEL